MKTRRKRRSFELKNILIKLAKGKNPRKKKQTRRRGKIGKKLKKYDELSPFELKNILIKLAKGKESKKDVKRWTR